MKPTPATLEDALKAVAREITMRANLYPKWVGAGRMSRDKAEAEQLGMRSALEWLDYVSKVFAGSPTIDRPTLKWLEESCFCVEPAIGAAMSNGGRLGVCAACKAADALESLALNRGKE